MGIAAKFSKRLHEEIDVHAAWVPVSNAFALGSYGVVSDGVLTKLGDISEFGVEVKSEAAPPVKLDFQTAGTHTVRLVGDAEVDALPAEPIEAKVRIEFAGSDGFLVKAPSTTVAQIPNVAQVAATLARADGWRRKYRVVWSTVTANDCLIVTSTGENAAFELSGNASVLRELGLGAVNAGLSVTSDRNVGVTVVGRSGVVGVRMFKLRWYGGDTPKMLGPDEEPEIDHDEAHELEDDV